MTNQKTLYFREFLLSESIQVLQRGSWQSQRRGRVASPVMIGADWKSTEIIRCPQGAQRPVDVVLCADRSGSGEAPGRAQCTTSLSGV